MNIDVLIATAGRPEMLERTLASLRGAGIGRGEARVIVVDNAGDDATRAVCDEAADGFPVQCVVETAGGKSTALNRGLEMVDAPLVAFTDDDVIVDDGWMDALAQGADRWPDHRVFGGRVLPRWPRTPPDWIEGSKYRGVAFSVLDPPLEEGPHEGFLPFGPNLAIRREVFEEGARFDPSIGPASGDYVMGNETEFVRRVTAGSRCPVFLPRSRVLHAVREEQLTLRWLLDRARRYGRSMVVHDLRQEEAADTAGPPRWLYSGVARHGLRSLAMAVVGRGSEAFDAAMDAAVDLGRLEAHR